jgi:hypothetical protein
VIMSTHELAEARPRASRSFSAMPAAGAVD